LAAAIALLALTGLLAIAQLDLEDVLGAGDISTEAALEMLEQQGAKTPTTEVIVQQAAIAVTDDNVYVVAEGSLLRYDKDLALVKQVELP
jgi:hypothetical protein